MGLCLCATHRKAGNGCNSWVTVYTLACPHGAHIYHPSNEGRIQYCSSSQTPASIFPPRCPGRFHRTSKTEVVQVSALWNTLQSASNNLCTSPFLPQG